LLEVHRRARREKARLIVFYVAPDLMPIGMLPREQGGGRGRDPVDLGDGLGVSVL